jgi:drug/metabolite transporter (DMT)-like permease
LEVDKALRPEILTVGYGLLAAANWGASDFSGGLATRRGNVYSVIVASQSLGCILLLVLALILRQAIPPTTDLVLGGVAGACGGLGLMALYTALARQRMGAVEPVAAVTNALLPVTVGISTQGLPGVPALVGFGLALAAVWLISRGDSKAPIRLRELGLPLGAGVGFGLFFILVGRVSQSSILWPLVFARLISVLLIALFAVIRGRPLRPARVQWLLIALVGVLDAAGNAFFSLATRSGRLDIAAVVSALYPGATVLLAWAMLHENLAAKQWLGVVAALIAVVLVTL